VTELPLESLFLLKGLFGLVTSFSVFFHNYEYFHKEKSIFELYKVFYPVCSQQKATIN